MVSLRDCAEHVHPDFRASKHPFVQMLIYFSGMLLGLDLLLVASRTGSILVVITVLQACSINYMLYLSLASSRLPVAYYQLDIYSSRRTFFFLKTLLLSVCCFRVCTRKKSSNIIETNKFVVGLPVVLSLPVSLFALFVLAYGLGYSLTLHTAQCGN